LERRRWYSLQPHPCLTNSAVCKLPRQFSYCFVT
jgi:hypothetical protein